MRRQTITFLFTALWSGCTCAGDVTIAPPRVPQGGRAVAIAVSQVNEKRLFVATESGGLFRTFDGGVSFQHLDAFPTFGPFDVEIASLAPSVVIATARDDFRTEPGGGGGIWRSTDDGGSWKRPSGWPPPPSPSCRSRPEAFGISHMPLSRTFYVATDCGLAVSTDDGASFSIQVLDPTAIQQFDSLQSRVRSVLVINRSTGVAADDSRLWSIVGGQWQPSTVAPNSGNIFAIHAFASPWWATAGLFYHTARDGRVWLSTDAGATWVEMDAPPWSQFREPFIRVGRGLDGDPTHIDVYYGDGFQMRRQAVTTAIPQGSNAWKLPESVDHQDPSDVAFDPGFEHPILLATDGGVHRTTDDGRNWKLTGSNFGGFVALQIGELTGRAVTGAKPHLDLYYGTQDNDIKGSADGSQTWTGSICCEGAFLMAGAADPAHADDEVTGRANGVNFLAPPHLGTFNPAPRFPNAPDGNPASPADAPFQLTGKTYLQNVKNLGPTPSFDFFLTHDRGVTWSPAFSLTKQPRSTVQFAGSLDNPVAYTGVKLGGSPEMHGLMRAQDVTAQASVRRADSTGMGSLGLLLTFQARYVVFGVDPSAPDHLLAPDILDGQMKASADGGISWYPVPHITTAVTDTGRFLPQRGAQTFATTIAWDPTNPCHILIGTMQNGVIRSADGGLTWKQVAGSKVVTYISSFFFPPSGAIWMSAYGRGLWTLSVDRQRPVGGRCQFPPPQGNTTFLDTLVIGPVAGAPPRPFGGLRDSLMCPTCTLVVVRNGWVTDLGMKEDQVAEIAISNGNVTPIDRAGREVALPVPNAYRASDGATIRRLAGRAFTDDRRVRAVLLDGTRFIALILGRDEMQLPGIRAPAVFVSSVGAAGGPADTESGDSVTVHGYGFVRGRGAGGADILLDGELVQRGIVVDADGRFTVTVRRTRRLGEPEVRVEQRNGKRLTIGWGSG